MSGPNQHHILQFLQRACGVKPPGKRPKQIWVHRPSSEPALELISKTAAEDHFYSEPADNGLKTLDELITEGEKSLSDVCKATRQTPCGSPIDAEIAADIITQLAPRSAHIRYTLTDATEHFAVNE